MLVTAVCCAWMASSPVASMQSPLAAQLGCEFSEGPLAFIKDGCNANHQRARRVRLRRRCTCHNNVAISVADGASAGLGAHQAALAASARRGNHAGKNDAGGVAPSRPFIETAGMSTSRSTTVLQTLA